MSCKCGDTQRNEPLSYATSYCDCIPHIHTSCSNQALDVEFAIHNPSHGEWYLLRKCSFFIQYFSFSSLGCCGLYHNESGVQFPTSIGEFVSLFRAMWPVLGSTRCLPQYVLGTISSGIKIQSSPSFSVEVKYEWNSTFTPLRTSSGRGA
jgi:hypothetical protein